MIPMQLNFDGLEYVVGGPDIVEMMSQSEPLAPFDEKILNFLGAAFFQVDGCRTSIS